MVSFTPRPLYPWVRVLVSPKRRLSAPNSRSGRFGEEDTAHAAHDLVTNTNFELSPVISEMARAHARTIE